jgi:DNA-binding ferritin-like protein
MSPDQPQLQKLLDEIAELKMIRELQKQVNARTKRYGEKSPEAEQTDDGQIKKELKDLGDRQERIETMVNNIVTKKNQ